MTAVVVHADHAEQAVRGAIRGAPCIEKIHRLLTGLDQAQRLGLETEVQITAGLRRKVGDGAAAGGQIFEDRSAARGFGGDEPFERSRHGADAPARSRRHELVQQREQLQGVRDALGSGPVGRVDLLLDARAVKTAVGKAVDRENRAVVPLQPKPESEQGGGFRKFRGGALTEPQPDGVRATRGDAPAHRQGVLLERREGFRPGFPAVDVGAVRELKAVVQLHPADESPRRNFGHCDRKRCGFR